VVDEIELEVVVELVEIVVELVEIVVDEVEVEVEVETEVVVEVVIVASVPSTKKSSQSQLPFGEVASKPGLPISVIAESETLILSVNLSILIIL